METFKQRRAMEPEYDTPLMALPFTDGDRVYVYDFSDNLFFAATIVMIGVRKKAEHKAIVVTLRDNEGTEYRRTLDKTCFVASDQGVLKHKVKVRLLEASRQIDLMDIDSQTAHQIQIF